MGKVPASVQVRRQTLILNQPNGERGSIRATVPADAEEFAKVYHVNPVSGCAFDAQAEGAWVSAAYAHHQGAKVGDKISVDAGDGVMHEIEIVGFYEYWLTRHELIMGRDFYEREFDTGFEPNALLVDASDTSVESLEESLADVDGFDSIIDDKAYEGANFTMFASVSRTVVLIYLSLSILMAIVVLLNLNVMFIGEKKRELIVLMINGFSTHDAKRYIYNDTIVLTVLGIVAGIVLGCVMGAATVGAIEPSTALFVKDIDPIAVAAGIGGSAVLAFIMSAIALRRIPRFELTDINKF